MYTVKIRLVCCRLEFYVLPTHLLETITNNILKICLQLARWMSPSAWTRSMSFNRSNRSWVLDSLVFCFCTYMTEVINPFSNFFSTDPGTKRNKKSAPSPSQKSKQVGIWFVFRLRRCGRFILCIFLIAMWCCLLNTKPHDYIFISYSTTVLWKYSTLKGKIEKDIPRNPNTENLQILAKLGNAFS
jgi:hypothetical protein